MSNTIRSLAPCRRGTRGSRRPRTRPLARGGMPAGRSAVSVPVPPPTRPAAVLAASGRGPLELQSGNARQISRGLRTSSLPRVSPRGRVVVRCRRPSGRAPLGHVDPRRSRARRTRCQASTRYCSHARPAASRTRPTAPRTHRPCARRVREGRAQGRRGRRARSTHAAGRQRASARRARAAARASRGRCCRCRVHRAPSTQPEAVGFGRGGAGPSPWRPPPPPPPPAAVAADELGVARLGGAGRAPAAALAPARELVGQPRGVLLDVGRQAVEAVAQLLVAVAAGVDLAVAAEVVERPGGRGRRAARAQRAELSGEAVAPAER